MLNRLEKYFGEVEHHLRSLPPTVREGELREIKSHLHQLTEDLQAEGHDPDGAAALAVQRFGTARSVGLRLRDVWEGNRGVLSCYAATILLNWALEAVSFVAWTISFFRVLYDYSALHSVFNPIFVIWIWSTITLLPLGMNFLLGRWGGRRIIGAALFAYLPLFLFSWWGLSFSVSFWIFKLQFIHISILMTILAITGAWAGSTLQRRRRMALVGGVPFERASSVLDSLRTPLARRLVRASCWALGICLVLTAITGWVKHHVDYVDYPPTPEAAVKVRLADPAINPMEMAPATNISLKLLPPVTPQERAGLERRVAFTATMHATKEYRERRLKYLHRELRQSRKQSQTWMYKIWESAIRRVDNNAHTIQGVLRVAQTSRGWAVDHKEYRQLRAWLYDNAYQESTLHTNATPLARR